MEWTKNIKGVLEKILKRNRRLTMRLDLFVKDKLNISRQKAREIIEQGLVTIDNKIITKPSYNATLMLILVLVVLKVY